MIVALLRERRVPWLADVAKRVAEAPNRDNRPGRWRLCAALLVAADLPAPTTDDAVLGWLSDRFGHAARRKGGIRGALALRSGRRGSDRRREDQVRRTQNLSTER